MKKKVYIVTDLGFGDSGKGGLVDSICSQSENPIVIRHSGGPQCAHNVHVNGKHHTFSQLGSGSFCGAPTVHLKTSVIYPGAMRKEMLKFYCTSKKAADITVDEDCLVVSEIHIAANQEKERRLRHGSCGYGYWETVSCPIKITVKDTQGDKCHELLKEIYDYYKSQGLKFDSGSQWDQYVESRRFDLMALRLSDVGNIARIKNTSQIANRVKRHDTLVFEGNQGVLLDEKYGFFPHVSGTSTPKHAVRFIDDYIGLNNVDLYNWGIVRSYLSRHGAGPLPGETQFSFSSEDNKENEWQGQFRAAPFNHDLINYAAQACCHASGITLNGIFVSHCDEGFEYDTHFASQMNKRFDGDLDHLKKLGEWVGSANFIRKPSVTRWSGSLCSLPVVGRSYGPDRKDKKIY